MQALSTLGHNIQQNGHTVTLMVDAPQTVPDIARAIINAGAELFELHPRQTSLEDIFVNIIGQTEGDGGA
ncbi:hypothetical protein D1872_347980 [compost metagenome]